MAERRSGTNTPARSEDVPSVGARIYLIRGERVMLDSDLAEAYQVETMRVNEAVRRNPKRFTDRYTFQLHKDEWDALISQIAISNRGRGGRRHLPWVFTEHGAVMLAAVLNSDRAIAASHAVIDAFVRLRHLLDANKELARRIDELNARFEKKTGEDTVRFHAIFQELKRLALGYDEEEAKPKGRIGFKTNEEREAERRGQQGRAKRKT